MGNKENKYVQIRLALDPEADKIVIEHLRRARNYTQYIRDLVMEDYKKWLGSSTHR